MLLPLFLDYLNLPIAIVHSPQLKDSEIASGFCLRGEDIAHANWMLRTTLLDGIPFLPK